MHYPTWLSKYNRVLWRWCERMSFYQPQQQKGKKMQQQNKIKKRLNNEGGAFCTQFCPTRPQNNVSVSSVYPKMNRQKGGQGWSRWGKSGRYETNAPLDMCSHLARLKQLWVQSYVNSHWPEDLTNLKIHPENAVRELPLPSIHLRPRWPTSVTSVVLMWN